MKRKVRLKNRAIKGRRKKKGNEWLVLIGVFVVLGLGVKFYEFIDIGIPVKSVKLKCDNGLNLDSLKDSKILTTGSNMFKINIKDIARSLGRTPEVKYVQVRRNFVEGKVEISIEEREPFVRVIREGSGACMDVDGSGMIIGRTKTLSAEMPFVTVNALDYPSMPQEEGRVNDSVMAGINLIKTAKAEGISPDEISELNMADKTDFIFITKDGVEFHLGSKEHPKKLKRMKRVLKEIKDKCVEYVDLRFGDEAIIKLSANN